MQRLLPDLFGPNPWGGPGVAPGWQEVPKPDDFTVWPHGRSRTSEARPALAARLGSTTGGPPHRWPSPTEQTLVLCGQRSLAGGALGQARPHSDQGN